MSALLFVIMVLVPVTLLFVAPVPPTDGRALLEYIDSNKAVYLTQLVSFVGLAVPAMLVFAALAVAVKGVDKSVAAIGGLLGAASEIIALALGSSPQSLHGGLVVLSSAYREADSEEQRAGLVSAADALIATTNAVSWGGVLTAAGILILSLLVRRAGLGRAVAVVGVVTGLLGIVSEALRPFLGAGYMIYGLLLPTWFAMVGWQLFTMTRPVRRRASRP
ncbi:hypothetical protein FOJ82_11640 [Tessaracoccus rhinocerotis]|uniref:DUF4386 family protein n=1 Tax=Tessaracoccus rhinocerotis TaxID=1689449 RepID=A0A553JZM9_9ACTN|nr:hypothetical protein [Tessaracoccus rhinocerotis]TRY17903.1 hypothetical protein FOJ82_11640 [Tessaracoccus rhinocerotis]